MIFPLFDRNPTSRFPLVTLLLIVANLAIAGWSSTLPLEDTLDLVHEYGFVPKRLTEVDSGKPLAIERDFGPFVYKTRLDTTPKPVYRSVLTMMFLHGGWLHVVSNMWMLWIFGNNIEDRLGHVVFAGFYLLGGVLAAGCQWVIDPASEMPVVGASGAVFAVLGGYAVTYPAAKVKSIVFLGFVLLLDLPALLVIGAYFVLDLMQGLEGLWGLGGAGRPIAHWAHIGGCVAGVVLMPLLSLGASPPGEDWRREAEGMLNIDTPQERTTP